MRVVGNAPLESATPFRSTSGNTVEDQVAYTMQEDLCERPRGFVGIIDVPSDKALECRILLVLGFDMILGEALRARRGRY